MWLRSLTRGLNAYYCTSSAAGINQCTAHELPNAQSSPHDCPGSNHCQMCPMPVGQCPDDSCPGNGFDGQMLCGPGDGNYCGDLVCQPFTDACVTNADKCIGTAVCKGEGDAKQAYRGVHVQTFRIVPHNCATAQPITVLISLHAR